MEFELTVILLTALAAMLIGFSKTAFPSMGILAVTVMALSFPAKDSVGIMLPMLIVGDIVTVIYYRRKVAWRHLVALIPWVLIGLGAGFFVLYRVESDSLQTMIGVLVLSLVGLHLAKNRLNDALANLIDKSRAFSVSMGSLAGFTTMIGNAAGGIMAIYLLSKRLDKTAFVGTGSWFFLSVNLIKVPFYISLGMIHGGSITLNAWMIPMILIGAFLGIQTLKRVPEKYFQAIILILTVVGGLRLLLQ